MVKRIFAILLCIAIAIPVFVSCESEDGAPEGMYSVTLDGEPFIFYVPETWTDNRDSGISSAYYSFTQGIMATAKYFACDEAVSYASAKTNEEKTKILKDYVDGVKAQNAEMLKDAKYALKNEGEDRIFSNLAQKYVYSFDRDDGGQKYNLTVTQYYTFHANGLVLLSLYVATEYYDTALSDFDKIKTNFMLCEKKASTREETDEYTPQGMKKASSDDVQYACYVPKTWITNLENKDTFAYFYDEKNPSAKNPNVSVTCYSPSKEYTVADFYNFIEGEYQAEGYKFITKEPTKLTVAGRDSLSFDYTMVSGGVTYKLRQIIIGYNSLIYSITYTATEDKFDTRLDDLKKITDAFRFR